jgi:hypothetical protein
MRAATLICVVSIALLAGCKSSAPTALPGETFGEARAPMAILEGPTVAPPANDIPESQRRAWLDAQHPRAQRVREPVRVERVIVREREPERHSHYDDRWAWAVPITFGLGYWAGHGHDHHSGWGWGVNWGWRGGYWW